MSRSDGALSSAMPYVYKTKFDDPRRNKRSASGGGSAGAQSSVAVMSPEVSAQAVAPTPAKDTGAHSSPKPDAGFKVARKPSSYRKELGIPEDVTHHLRNADSGGRSIGRALQELMEMSGSNPQAFVQALASLTPAQANDLAEASHGVDPNNDNVLPATDEYAAYAGLSREELNDQGINANGPIYFTYTRPHSLDGLRNYIVRQGISLPVG